jgi:hypothetical protein
MSNNNDNDNSSSKSRLNETFKNLRQWHHIFIAAIKTYFEPFEQYLDIYPEYTSIVFNRRTDVIIKKLCDNKLNSQIAEPFLEYNHFEFFSSDVSLTDKSFMLSISRVGLFINDCADANLNNVTLTIMLDTFPKNVFNILKEKNILIIEKYPGIYYIQNFVFPLQIIIPKALIGDEKFFFGYIRPDVPKKVLSEVVTEIYKLRKNFKKYIDFFELLFKANPLSFEEARLTMPEFAEIVRDLPFVKQLMAECQEKGREEGREEGVLKTKIEVALNALTSDPPSTISYITLLTGLSEKKILFLNDQLGQLTVTQILDLVDEKGEHFFSISID